MSERGLELQCTTDVFLRRVDRNKWSFVASSELPIYSVSIVAVLVTPIVRYSVSLSLFNNDSPERAAKDHGFSIGDISSIDLLHSMTLGCAMT